MGRDKRKTSEKVKQFKIIINPFAELDLQVAFEWYELQKEKLGIKFIHQVDKIIERIKSNPKQFPKVYKKIRRANVNRFPFGVFFIVHANTAIVFAIFHNSRNPVVWKERFGNK